MFGSPGSRSSFNRLQASMRRTAATTRGMDGTNRVSLSRAFGWLGSIFFRDAGNSGSSTIGKLDFGFFDWVGSSNCLIYGRSGQDPDGNWASGNNYFIRFDNDPYGIAFSVNSNGAVSCSGNVGAPGGFFGGCSIGSPYLGGGFFTAAAAGGIAIGVTQSALDTFLYRDGAGLWADSNGANAQGFRVYNTTDGSAGVTSVNYERGVFDWQGTSNVLTIGTEKGGTGTTRNVQFKIGGTVKLNYGVTNAGKWTFVDPPVVPPFTVSTLPTGVAGAQAYVTDGDSGLAWGATAINSGSGSTKYLVWYNGSAWTVMGK